MGTLRIRYGAYEVSFMRPTSSLVKHSMQLMNGVHNVAIPIVARV